jgi:hypothetical protein
VGTKGWAERINAALRESAASIIKAGHLLIECKAAVRHGEFTKMLENDLDCDPDRAQRLMKIAGDKRLSDPANSRYLPSRLFTLHDLTALSDEQLRGGIEDGTINKDMRRADVKKLREPKPKVTDAEYRDVTESPVARSGDAVSAQGGSDFRGVIASAEDPTPQDDREGGDSVVTASDIVRDPVLLEDVLDSSVTADRADNEAPTPVATGGRTDGEMLAYMGMDAGKWAAEFCRIAGERGQQNLDAGWVLGWFANAIETARDVGRATVATPPRADESRVRPPHEGMIGYWLDPHNHARNLPAGLTLAMNASKELTPAEAVKQWPEAMPLLSGDLDSFAEWIEDAAELWRKLHGEGNDAGLQAAE